MARIGYVFAKSAFDALKAKMDPRRANGGVFLGLEGIVIKSHGGTDEVGFAGASDMGYKMVRQDLLSRIRESLSAWQDSRTALAALAITAHPAPETD